MSDTDRTDKLIAIAIADVEEKARIAIEAVMERAANAEHIASANRIVLNSLIKVMFLHGSDDLKSVLNRTLWDDVGILEDAQSTQAESWARMAKVLGDRPKAA